MARKGLACRFMAFNTPIAIDFDLHQRRCLCLLPFSIAIIACAIHFEPPELVPWQLHSSSLSQCGRAKALLPNPIFSMLSIQRLLFKTVATKAVYKDLKFYGTQTSNEQNVTAAGQGGSGVRNAI